MEQKEALNYDIASLDDEYLIGDRKVFSYHIEYIIFDVNAPGFDALNQRSYRYALTQQSYAVNTIYGNALQAYYQGSAALPYEYDSHIVITMNQDHVFSAYQDEYIFTGGAHGNTTRTSFTYDTISGVTRTLCSFMQSPGCLTCISNNIINQIKNSGQTDVYFPNYSDLVPQTLQPEDFYVTPQGVVIYFGLYEIAPYASGIRTFTIPFNAC